MPALSAIETTLDPLHDGTPVRFRKQYGNFIGGEWVAPVEGQYFKNITPVTGKVRCEKTAEQTPVSILILMELIGSTLPAGVLNVVNGFGRGIEAGRVWTNCYHLYPAHAAFEGYKQSGIGRENHLMMLEHYRQTKSQLISYSTQKLGIF